MPDPETPAVHACRLCRHWCGFAPDLASGECRINVPQLIVRQEGEPRRVFPLTFASDWCGAWSADPARLAAEFEAQEARHRAAIKKIEAKLKNALKALEAARGNPAPAQAGETVRGIEFTPGQADDAADALDQLRQDAPNDG